MLTLGRPAALRALLKNFINLLVRAFRYTVVHVKHIETQQTKETKALLENQPLPGEEDEEREESWEG